MPTPGPTKQLSAKSASATRKTREPTEIKIDGEDFLIMKEEEVLGVITGAAKKQTVGAKR